MNLIKAEFFKQKRMHLLVIIAAINLLAFGIGALLYFQNESVFASYHTQWFALWSEAGQFASLVFFPVLLALIVAMMINLEQKRKNFNRMATLPVSAWQLAFAKFITASLLAGMMLLLFVVIFYVVAVLSGLPSSGQSTVFISWGLLGWVAALPVVALQLWFSLMKKSFTTPLIWALILSLASFVVMMLNANWLAFYPYAQMFIGLHARSYLPLASSELICFGGVNALFTLIGLIGSVAKLKKMGFD